MKTKNALVLGLLALVATVGFAQPKIERQAIKDFCGCFEVDFKFKETFAHVDDYELKDIYEASALELVVLEEDSKDKIVLQHILIVDTMIIKHWRQDWEYEPDHLFSYEGDHTWEVFNVDRRNHKGQWSQEVYGTDDTPRYAASASWVIADRKRYWASTTDAPLPRREYTKRDDYQIMRRLNDHQLVDDGWVHEQDNEKVILTGKGESVLVEEKGRNTYTRTDASKCESAAQWWKEHRAYWKEVRTVWDEWLDEPKVYTVHKRQGEKFLPKELKALEKQEFADADELRAAIRKTLDAFVDIKNDASAMN